MERAETCHQLVDRMTKNVSFQVPTCCSCHIMGYSYVYPPLKTPHASSRIDDFVEPLPTTPPGFNQPPPPQTSQSLFPNLNPQGEFQNFLSNLGNKFTALSRGTVRGDDMAGRPSQLVPKKKEQPRPPQRRVRPNQSPGQNNDLPPQRRRFPIRNKRLPSLPRRKMDEGPVRPKNFLEK